jgi:hypothetical protein
MAQKINVQIVAFCFIMVSELLLAGCFWRKRPEPWSPNPIHVPPTAAGEFNVLWDNTDENGLPRDPYWEAQTSRYQQMLPPLSDPQHQACVQTPYLEAPSGQGQEACTVQDTVIDTPEDFPNVLCFFYPGSTVHGHVNWMAASVSGYLSWLNLADDWDYNFRLVPRTQDNAPQQDRGLTANNNRVTDGSSPRYMEIEFASSEVADQFRTAWWQGLAKLVDPLDLPALSKYIHPSTPNQEPFAVTVGLFGLDCEHDCRSELHPVYALAIQLDENPTSNTWAIFVRNWGDEGFCSSLNHEISLTDGKMKLLLPWPGAKGLKAELEQISPGVVAPVVGLLQDDHGNGEGALVTFALPKPSEQGLIEVVFRFEWTGGTAIPAHTVAAGVSLAEAVPHPASEGEQDAEQLLGGLKKQAGVSRPKVSTLAVPPGVPPVVQPQNLKVQLYRRPPKTVSRAPGVLGESLSTPVECGGPASAKPCPIDNAKRKRDIELWKKICAGLKGNYSDQRIAENCAKVEVLY